MAGIPTDVLLELVAAISEPVLLVRVDSPDWPIELANPAFHALSDDAELLNTSFPEVIQPMIGKEMTREASAALRTLEAATIPVDVASREFLLTLLPICPTDGSPTAYCAAYLRTAGRQVPVTGDGKTVSALAAATRRVRDLSGEDPVTGLMNERAFRDILAHDWSVAAREGAILGLTSFRFDDYDAYAGVFGRHGAESSQRRVAQIIRRNLRRASDVAARTSGEEGGVILVLSHGSDQDALDAFAETIAASVHELGLHHPRSRYDRFVTTSWHAKSFDPRSQKGSPESALDRLLRGGGLQHAAVVGR
ncbi:MAG: diguanylate cyclase [Pseudomonadota bacterium]